MKRKRRKGGGGGKEKKRKEKGGTKEIPLFEPLICKSPEPEEQWEKTAPAFPQMDFHF